MALFYLLSFCGGQSGEPKKVFIKKVGFRDGSEKMRWGQCCTKEQYFESTGMYAFDKKNF